LPLTPDAALAPLDVGLLVGVAFATSILSAVVGMAGGITLLSVMLLYLDPLVAIPIHGVVQLVSNGSRAWVQRAHVDRRIAWRYGVLLLPMGFAGLWLARALSPDATRLAIGVFVLVATWAPRWLLLGSHPDTIDRDRRFLLLGGVVGFLNVTIGATGPLIAPFFLNLGLSRQALVGTKAACQLLGHLAKLVVFGVVGFAYAGWAGLLAGLCAAVVVGTWVGSRLLERVDEKTFVRLYKTVLTLIALRLIGAVVVSLQTAPT
jgi:uncharacterized membrane protein YfcA